MNYLTEFVYYHQNGSSVRIGLFYKERLVFLTTFSRTRHAKNYEWQVCTVSELNNFNIVGAFKRTVDTFSKIFSPKSLAIYLDRRWFIKEQIPEGFAFEKFTKPNLWWTIRSERYPIHMFKRNKLNDVLDDYNPSLSIMDNMRNNGYLRIYDCGKIVAVKRF